MQIAADSLAPEAAYRLLTGIVVPRPIAWVTTLGGSGVVNLAPFSCFTFVSNAPPMVGINVGRKAGVRKDTAVNIHAMGEFVVNIGDVGHIEAIHQSSVEHPPEVSEAALLGLATEASGSIRTPRLRDVPIAMECRLERAIEFGHGGSEFLVGEVLRFHVRDDLWENGRIDTRRLQPVCRLGGPNYAVLGEIVTLRAVEQTPKTVIAPGA